MMKTRALAAMLLSGLMLSACGLKPIYAGGGSATATAMLSDIQIAPIADRAGFLMEQALRQQLRPASNPRYRLDVKLDDAIEGFGIRGDDSIARERRTLRARWQLVDTVAGKTLIDATARADAGIDVVSSDYAVVAAENAALERLADDLARQITTRIAVEARQSPAP